MAGTNKSKRAQTEAAVARVAELEQFIQQVQSAEEAASTYHKSELAARSLANAGASLADAVKNLSLGHLARVDRLLNASWFYAKFAQDIVGAEATEHLLGNDRFFDLIEPASLVQSRLDQDLSGISRMIDEIEKLIPPLWDRPAENHEGGRD